MKILMITARFPYPPRKGDQALPFHRIREMAGRHEITLVSLSHASVCPDSVRRLQEWCAEVHVVPASSGLSFLRVGAGVFSSEPLQMAWFASHALKELLTRILATTRFDVAHAYTLRMAPYLAMAGAAGVPTFLDLIDSMVLNFQRRIATAPWYLRPVLREELRRVSNYEQTVQQRFTRLLVVGSRDASFFANAAVVPLGVCLEEFSPQPHLQIPGRIILSGNMGYTPNIDAATWFVREVFPLVKQQIPLAEFCIAGVNPTRDVQKLAEVDGVSVVGAVADMGATLNTAQVAVAPMQSGSGMQFKILEAMACGLPVVTTSLGLGSLQAVPGRHLAVCDQPAAYADSVIHLLKDSCERERLGEAARGFVVEHHSWFSHVASLETLYAAAQKPV